MKTIILAIGLLFGAQAFAHSAHSSGRDCTPYQDASRWGGQNGENAWNYPCGEGYSVKYRACKEGEVAYFHESDSRDGGQGQEVARVCHNGTFFPNTGDVAHRGCTEGEIAYSNIINQTGHHQEVTVVCHNGHFVQEP